MVEGSKIRGCVRDSSFPASVESILESARQHHCSMDAMAELTHLPARRYGAADEVVSEVTSSASTRPS
jgi:hypothetical protein